MSGALAPSAPAPVVRPWPSAEALAQAYPPRPVVMLRVSGRRRACLALMLPAGEDGGPERGLIVTDDLAALVDTPVVVDPMDILRRFDALPHREVVEAWHAYDTARAAHSASQEVS